MPLYRLHDTTGDDLGLLEHPAPNLEPRDVVVVADGREAIVTARVEAAQRSGAMVAMLGVAIAPDFVTAVSARHMSPGSVTPGKASKNQRH